MLVFILNLISLVCIIMALYYTRKTFDLTDKIIADQMQYIEDQQEALDRSRGIRRMFQEENTRCWKALEVMTANYNEVVEMLQKEGKEIPQK